MALPGNYNFAIYQGGTFNETWLWSEGGVGVNLSGYTAAMSIVYGGTVLVALTSGSGLTLGSNGMIGVTISATQTQAMPTNVVAAYDLFLTDGSGNATPLLAGQVSISPRITQ